MSPNVNPALNANPALSRPLRILAAALLVAGLLAVHAPAAAQTGKLAIINTQQIVLESKTGKAALEELRTLQEQKEGEARAKQQELTDLRNRISEGRLSLAEDKLAEMQSELESKTRDLRRFQEDTTAELDKRQQEVLKKIEDRVMPIINQIGAEEGYDMIFRKFESGLIYVNDATMDITEKVIQRLDATAEQGQ